MKYFTMIDKYTQEDKWYNYVVACLQQYELKHLEANLMKYEEGYKNIPPYIVRFARGKDNALQLVQSYYELRWNCY